MGLSSSKQKTTTNQKTTEQATTTPSNPPWVTDSIQALTGKINEFGELDPMSMVAGPSDLQQQAFAQAGKLGGWQHGNEGAMALTQAAAGAPANLASFQGYSAPEIGSAQLGAPAMMTSQGYAPQTMTAAQAQMRGYDALLGGAAPQASLSTFSAPQLGPAIGYDAALAEAARLGPIALASAQGYDAARAERTALGPLMQGIATTATAQSMMDGGLDRYLNPATEALVTSTLADMDADAARARAAQAADGARNRALAGSRFGIREAATEGELSRARAAAEAQLRNAAFGQAIGMAQYDSTNRQQTALHNSGLLTETSMRNAQMGNEHSQLQGQLDQNLKFFNTGADNDARAFKARALNDLSQFNTGQQNAMTQLQGQLDQQKNIANAGFLNDERSFKAAADNSRNLTQGQLDLAAVSQNASAANDLAKYNTGLKAEGQWRDQEALNKAAEFKAAADNQGEIANAGYRQQASAANIEAGNRAAEFGTNWLNMANQGNAQALRDFDLARYAAENQRSLAQAGLDADAAQFAATAFNGNQQFNAGQLDAATMRQLQGAGLMGDLSNNLAGNQRADLGALADLGLQQWQIDQLRAQAPAEQMKTLAALYGSTPFNLLNGQNVSRTSTSDGTSLTKDTPSLFSQALAAGQLAASVIKSDVRAKRDIEKAGMLSNGLGLYRYRYLWDADERTPRVGVMAQEVARIAPDALGPITDGYMTVNYGKLGLAHLVEA